MSKSKKRKKAAPQKRIQEKKHDGLAAVIITILFTAVNILIVRGIRYERDMSGFYWTSGGSSLLDFFSYSKMIFIIILAVIALIILVCRAIAGTFPEKKRAIYIPIGIYAAFIIISFIASSEKEFALLGYNEQFEGTLVLLSYLIMLVFIINSITEEYQIRLITAAVGAACMILGMIGISQATGHDFFQSSLGKHLITPTSMWNNLDSLVFNFKNNEIYQTVFNINYVSFYLAMVIPVCGMMIVYGINDLKKTKKSIGLCIGALALFALMLFNFAGARSLGGAAGLAAAFIAALLLFNVRLIKWWRSVLCVALVTVIMLAATSSMWLPEISEYISPAKVYAEEAEQRSGDAKQNEQPEEADEDQADTEQSGEKETTAGTQKPYIDYIYTDGYDVHFSINGEELIFSAVFGEEENTLRDIALRDKAENSITSTEIEESGRYEIQDERFHDFATFRLVQDNEENLYISVNTAEQEWPFIILADGIKYRNGFGKSVDLEKINSIGFKDNPSFGSGRGYIWSRTLAMLTDNILIGDGANTYCINFPHNDYAGKYNSGVFSNNIDIIVDKPHNMYMGMFQGTGGVSMLCFIAMLLIYLYQSIKLLIKRKYSTWLEYMAAGIFLGIIGFLAAGIFNDSNVSVMPMFYGLLGCGTAANNILNRQTV